MALLIALALIGPARAQEGVVVRVVDGDGQPVAGAAVYLTPTDAAAPASTAASAIMDQIGYQFVPRLLVVRTGTEVAFPNSDNVLHHVYSFSEAKRFELPLYAGTIHAPVRFDRAGLVTLGCNIHDDMVGYILVVDTPWFGKTDADGRFAFEDLPAGRYDVSAWSDRQRDANTILHASLALIAGERAAPLMLALGRLRPPPAERHTGTLWKAY
jgi:plastocyanin